MSKLIQKQKPLKALVLTSGGLDSLLAAKLLIDQGLRVEAICFESCFFNAQKAQKNIAQLKIPLKVVDFSQEHLTLVKNPPRGYGKAANPCIDCHLLMLKKAKEIMEHEGFDLVATGEVLGQRPFSQNRQALAVIAKKSGLKDRLLRPLSAKLLPPIILEKQNLIDREKLLGISGRSRKIQEKLAKEYHLEYPQPAGGCILTETEFSQKLLDLFKKWPKATPEDVKLLFLGRHFWHQEAKIVLGKNKAENQALAQLVGKKDRLIVPGNFPGPTALIRGKIDSLVLKRAEELILQHSKKKLIKPQFSRETA